jgi:predicted Zn-dependent protease
LKKQKREVDSDYDRTIKIKEKFEEGKQMLEAKNFSDARTTFGTLLRDTEAPCVILGAARAEIGIGFTDRALRLTLQLLRKKHEDLAIYVVRGRATYLSGDITNGEKLLKHVLQSDPDMREGQKYIKIIRKIKKAMAAEKESTMKRDFNASIEHLTAALDADEIPDRAPLAAILKVKRARCYLRLKETRKCLNDCGAAIRAQDDCKEAWLMKAQALHSLGRHKEVLDDMKYLMTR